MRPEGETTLQTGWEERQTCSCPGRVPHGSRPEEVQVAAQGVHDSGRHLGAGKKKTTTITRVASNTFAVYPGRRMAIYC